MDYRQPNPSKKAVVPTLSLLTDYYVGDYNGNILR